MQPLNDDMEELFRRAGEEYPLDTSGADWNKVMQQLRPADDDLPIAAKTQKDYRYLWLLLLLPIGFMIGRYFSHDHKGGVVKSKDVAVATSPSHAAKPTGGTAIANMKNVEGTDSKGSGTLHEAGEGSTNNKAGNSIKNVANSNSVSSVHQTKRSINVKAVNKLKASATTLAGSEVLSKAASIDPKNRVKSVDQPLQANNAYGNQQEMEAGQNTSTGTAPSDEIKVAASNPVDTSTTAAAVNKSDIKPATEQKTETSKQGINKKRQESFKRKLYYSFVIGPDVSTVKNAKSSNVGYSLGLMLGYQLGKKITVEGGLLWDRKNYYANGEYLDTTKLQLPTHSIVSSVDGYCNMIEIPVNVKYNFISNQKHSWFVSGGLSSYLMKNENYNLVYGRYGMPYEKDYGYKNSSKDWFSILNVSAGYQKSLSKYTSISIAPYVKLPLKGVGIGKLPIRSTGIYLSISRSIH